MSDIFSFEIGFLDAIQPKIKRGWDCGEVQLLLNSMGVPTHNFFIRNENDLLGVLEASPQNMLFWPQAYEIHGGPSEGFLPNYFVTHKRRYVGVGSSTMCLSSKLNMKARINETNIVKTPNYMNLPTNSAGLSELGFPAILKSEFSCNSEGIAKVINLDDALNKIEAFRELYGQRIFLEAWERQNEYTVAYVPPSLNEAGEAAALKLLLSNQSDYYDLETKSSKINVSFIRPKKETAEVLEKVTLDLVEELSIDGHFRADYIQNEKNELFLIDLNFMPYLSIVEGSTFPKAFEQKGQWRFEKLIFRLIAHSIERIL